MAVQTVRGLHTFTFSSMHVPRWVEVVAYLVSHAGRWVPASELGDFVYQGVCSKRAPHVLVHRARRAGVRIESSAFGYRVGREERRACPECGALVVVYGDGERVCYGCVGTEFAELEVGRAAYREGSRQGKAWTPEEIAFVLEHDAVMGLEEMGRRLDRSASAVRGLRAQLGLARKSYVRGEGGGR